MPMSIHSRRHFVNNLGTLAAAGVAFGAMPSLFAAVGAGGGRKLGVALVGLGGYSQGKLGPALKETELCKLSAIVTGSPGKVADWVQEHGLKKENVYSYETFDQIASNPEIDIVYVVLPNNMHKEYTIRALRAGKHVIVEKPMALDARECREMIKEARKAGRMLGVGYRMHYDPYFIEVKRLGAEKVLGEVTYLECGLGYYGAPRPGHWHTKKAMGGGSLYNLGVYPIQSARFTKGGVPSRVTAQASTTRKELFPEVAESYTWQMLWEDGTIAHNYSGSSATIDRLYAACSNGFIELSPTTGYVGPSGRTSRGPLTYPKVNQQALQMDDFARCVLENKPTLVGGEEGLIDMLIIDAIHESIDSNGKEVKVGALGV